MNIIKKITISALLGLSVFGLTASLPAYADGASDAAYYCGLCHGLVVNGVNVTPNGGRLGPQRSADAWMTTIASMRNSFGCPVPPELDAGIANYLASIPPATTTTTLATTSSTVTTVATTTTTTLCNTVVNGTTQYPYSGSGSCHSFANDDVTGAHIVRDQSYCKKHISHFNSKGNHVHAYPHPACM